MRKLKKISLPFPIFLIIALMICSMACFFSLKDIQYSRYLERAQGFSFIMSQIGDHLNIAFESKWNRVRFLSTRMERLNPTTIDDLIKELDDIYMETGADFKAVDENGIAYYHNGMQEYWKNHRSVLPESDTFIQSPHQFGLTNENYMKYIVPLKKPIVIGDVKIMYTVLTEPLDAIQKDFDTSNYGEGCLSFVINKSGTFVYENSSGDPMADSYNFLAYVEKTVHFLYGETFEHFKENIDNGVSATVLVEYNGKNYYMSHFNLAMGDWVSIILVPEDNTQAEDVTLAQNILGDIAIVFAAAFLLFIIGFFYMWKKTVTKQRMAAEAERRSNEAKTNFLSAMSHDIRTPMNAIIGMTDIALHDKNDIPRPVRDKLEKIRLSSTHLLMLINDILDLSKIESGKMSLNIAEFSIVEATNTLANLIRPLAKDKNIDLRIHTNNYRQEHLIGDELRISQVYINLATNAIKYTKGGGRVDIDFKQEFPENMPDKVRLICTVRDNGIGMSEEYQKVMYEVFSRATDSRVNKVAGSGLGLSICHKMVEMMDGTLECESAPGQGTTFTVTVILEKGRPDEIYRLPEMRVLVIDRDTMSTDAFRRGFKRLDVDADIINEPSQLAAVLEQKRVYQAAFVELGAPQNAGIDTVKKLRKHLGEDIPVILTDIADMSEYAEQISEAGIKLTMSKPYYYRIVYQTIVSALKLKKADIATKDEQKNHALSGMNVLVAEDNELNWEILCEFLNMNDVKAERAENGKICVDMLKAAKPSYYAAVLMDVRMPDMDGLEATRVIRKSKIEWMKTIPIIAMTADAFDEDIHECLEAGMDAHLSKPINFNKLLSALSGLID